MLLNCNIYKGPHGDCSNGGISSKHDSVLLSTDPENDKLEDQSLPVVKLITRWKGISNEYVHAEPVEPEPENVLPYMASGCFIYTSDSRFPANYPIPLHDRMETQKEYNSLSC